MKTWIAAGCAVALGLGGGCGRPEKPDASGTVEVTEVRVAAEVAGRILALPACEGQAVQKGDLLARLDPATHEARLAEARAARDLAQAQLDLLKAGSRTEDIRRAEAQWREAKAAAWVAEQTLTRIRKLFEQGSVSEQQADEAKASAERTAAAAASAGEQYEKLVKGSRAEEIRAAEAGLAQASARVALAEKSLRDTEVRSPIGGTVLLRVAETGELAAPGSPLATVADLQDAWLTLYIPEPRLASVKLGSKVRVRVDGRTDSYTGTVSFISPQAEFTPRNVQTSEERAKLVYRVKVTLPESEGVFKPGLPADAWWGIP